MSQIPLKTEISDTAPNPSNAVARVGFARIYDWLRWLLGMWVTAGGTANALSATYVPAIQSLEDGQVCKVRALLANTTTDPTFSPNGLSAYPIKMLGGVALPAGGIAGPGHELVLVFNSAGLRWELQNPAVVLTGKADIDGANTSGTWPIDITGNALTATTAASAASASGLTGSIVAEANLMNNSVGVTKLKREGASGQALISGGPGVDPYWGNIAGGVTAFNTRSGAVTLTAADVTNALAVANKYVLVAIHGGGSLGVGVPGYDIGGTVYYDAYGRITGTAGSNCNCNCNCG
jgi:hypothetical protein